MLRGTFLFVVLGAATTESRAQEVCKPSSGYRFVRISNANLPSDCSNAWHLHELSFGGTKGSRLALKVDAASGPQENPSIDRVIDNDSETYAEILADCVDGQAAKQWIIIDLDAARPITSITATQSGASDASVSTIQYECSQDKSVWTQGVLVDVTPGTATLFQYSADFSTTINDPDHIKAISLLTASEADSMKVGEELSSLTLRKDERQKDFVLAFQEYFDKIQSHTDSTKVHAEAQKRLCEEKKTILIHMKAVSEANQQATDTAKQDLASVKTLLDQKQVERDNVTSTIDEYRMQAEEKAKLVQAVQDAGQPDTSFEKGWLAETENTIQVLEGTSADVAKEIGDISEQMSQANVRLKELESTSRKSRTELELWEKQVVLCEEKLSNIKEQLEDRKRALDIETNRVQNVHHIDECINAASHDALETCEQGLKKCRNEVSDCHEDLGSDENNESYGEDSFHASTEGMNHLEVFYNTFKDIEDAAVELYVTGLMSGIRQCREHAKTQGMLRNSRRSGPGGKPIGFSCPGYLVLLVDKIMNSKSGSTLVELLRIQCPDLSVEDPSEENLGTGPKWAQVQIAIDDESKARECIKAIGQQKGKRPNIKLVKLSVSSPRD